jgi:predicted Rossmann-fold nucleotide-binding protein
MTRITWPDQFWKDMVPSCSADTDALRNARNSALTEILDACAGRPIVAVSGSGAPDSHRKEAQFIGALIARLGLNLINGGIDGVMFDVTEGFLATVAKLPGGSSSGTAIRVIPADPKRVAKAKQLSASLTGAKCIFTELESRSQLGPDSRNHVLIAASDVVICLPGQEGSKSEARLAKQVYHKPVITYGTTGRGEDDWKKSIECYQIGRTENPETWLRQALHLGQS